MKAAAHLLLLAASAAGAEPVRIQVLGLFRSPLADLQPAGAGPLIVETPRGNVVLEGRATLRLRAANAPAALPPGSRFRLRIPGKIDRDYHGALRVQEDGAALALVVEMEIETAVASVVAAESVPGAPPAALQAQAVVARSFYRALRGRHSRADFCDTTHCQFLRHPPRAGSPARDAALSTRGLTLEYRGRAIEAFFSSRCGGRTRALAEAGWAISAYPYFAVECASCRRDRRPAQGHRVGLCQHGAAAMARGGAGFRQILAHYFPGAEVR
ncbi:MAG: hypothetical protein K2X35_22355 [Bryobacteraceae bacterium]|nr:hypothetical protein [Bryobacteraceae bacterium]